VCCTGICAFVQSTVRAITKDVVQRDPRIGEAVVSEGFDKANAIVPSARSRDGAKEQPSADMTWGIGKT